MRYLPVPVQKLPVERTQLCFVRIPVWLTTTAGDHRPLEKSAGEAQLMQE
jgi:hypothetical protein